MRNYTLSKYLEAGCTMLNDEIGMHLHKETGGKICDTGCGKFNNGRCTAYLNLIKERKTFVKPIETVREEAKRRGISISKIRKYRRDLCPEKQ